MSDETPPTVGRRTLLEQSSGALGMTILLTGCVTDIPTRTPSPTRSPFPRTTPTPTPESMTPFDASVHEKYPDVEPIEKKIFQFSNVARHEHGLETLEWNKDLAYVGRDHSRDMAQRDYFSHENPDGERSWNRVEKYGIEFDWVSENIASSGVTGLGGVERIAEVVHEMWMTSEGHRENLLAARWSYEGVGVYMTSNGIIATQMFAGNDSN